MKKWAMIIPSVLVLMAMMADFTLARPEAAPAAASDQFCGFWLVYDREENMNARTFDAASEAQQTLLLYQMSAGDEGGEPAYTTMSGSSLGEVSMHMNVKDNAQELEVRGTLYVIPERDQDLWMQADREIWLYEDVVASLAHSLQKPESGDGLGWIQPGQTALVYVSPEQMEAHGQEMTDMAQRAGVALTLKTQSPRYLSVCPVFMRPDGSMYANTDDRHHVNIQTNTTAGYSMSVENTETINGKTAQKRVSASLSVKTVDALQSIRLVEMGADNTPVKTSDLPFDRLRDLSNRHSPYEADQQAAYVLVEETFQNAAGESYVKRTAVSPPAGDGRKASQTFYLPLGDGLTEAVSLDFMF